MNRLDGLQHMHIPSGQTYQSPGEAYVEGDASSASYFLAGAHLLPGCPQSACALLGVGRGCLGRKATWCKMLVQQYGWCARDARAAAQ